MREPKINPWRIIWKTLLVLLVVNFVYPWLKVPNFSAISLYNSVFPGRQRLPFGENPGLSYNLTLDDINAMFDSHRIAAADATAEYSIVLIGDSSIWGTLLENDQTIAARLQAIVDSRLSTRDEPTRVYNLGYPTISVLKDLVIVDQALRYEPDMVIWFVTLNSLVKDSYKDAPIVLNNPEKANAVINKYALDIGELPRQNYWERTFINQRRSIYDRIHLQLLAPMWASTGIDQYIPEEFSPAARDLDADDAYEGIAGDSISEGDLDISVIANFIEKNPDVEVIVVNEPILISTGENSEIRYNLYYPRWAFDSYREFLSTKFAEMEIQYIDLWDAVPEFLFTNSAIHYTEQGVDIVSEKIYSFIEKDLRSK